MFAFWGMVSMHDNSISFFYLIKSMPFYRKLKFANKTPGCLKVRDFKSKLITWTITRLNTKAVLRRGALS